MDETVEHVSKGFLGLTMNCAKCHDHKYDPISQVDYYRMRAIFEPYHVRLDVVPGEPDLARDGMPRVFDGLPDAPTYVFERGQESNPISRPSSHQACQNIAGVRRFRGPTCPLPKEAWQPERRPWVLDAYLAAAKKRRCC